MMTMIPPTTSPAAGEAGERLLGDAGVVEKEVPVAIDAFMISVGGHPAALPADLTDIERAATPAPKPITG
ncbi:MAG TPA: hypothetical protein VM428_07170 [Microlunatus sp.]|jgi:hypothetical protein|nr:hypothetical protein [Microlunatus sp.]